MYDYLIVGAGLFGAVFARQAMDEDKSCLVVERRSHIGGNIYTEEMEGIHVHKYGAHIFHTDNEEVWNYVNQYAVFNRYTNSPVAVYKDELYNLPFNMNTFHQLWGVKTPAEARARLEAQIADAGITEPKNLEEQALSLVGRDIYQKLVKGYTEKQWGRSSTELPPFIIKRLPVRMTYDNNYFDDRYQGIPVEGYTKLVHRLLEGADVHLGVDFLTNRKRWESMAKKIVYTGMIDEYFGYCYGELEYRSLRFETEVLEEENHQGNAVVNYTEFEVPYTRMIEHKHFMMDRHKDKINPKTILTREFPVTWHKGDEPYYPINDDKNGKLYKKYLALAAEEERVIFGGRLGMYRYFDMDDVVAAALDCVRKELGEKA